MTEDETLLHLIWRNWPVASVSLVALYFLSNNFNRSLHKYPGPILAGLSDWWRFFDVWGRYAERTHIQLHKTYGDVVRLGPNTLMFGNPDALKEIYGLNKGFTKSEFYPVQQSVSAGKRLPSLFSTTSETFHQQLRRCVNSAFSMSSLTQYEPLVDSTTKIFLQQTEDIFAKQEQSCDFAKWLQFYAFDVIGEMTYSKRHGFVEQNRDIDGVVKYIGDLFSYVAPVGQIPWLDLIFLKNPLYLKLSEWGFANATFPIVTFAKARMAERASKSEASDSDLLSKFLQAGKNHPDVMTEQRVLTMAVSMAFAGSETTAISLSSVFYFLLKHPSCLQKLLSELDEKACEGYFADSEHGIVTWKESQGLPYLDACIKEAFRLHPAPGLPLERVVPQEGATIAGHFVKGGAIVGCSAWVIHRRPEIFGEDVEAYRPERWLVSKDLNEEAETKRIKEMGSTLLHFGMGARTCIGKNISLLEIYKLVPSVLRRFEVRLEHPEKEWTTYNAWFVRQLDFRTIFRRKEIVKPVSV